MTIAIRVVCYAGHRADQRPQRFTLGAEELPVVEVQDQWYDPEALYFKVLAGDGNIYILRHDEGTGAWTLQAFRSTRVSPPTCR
jgi:hypothetical protein